MVVMSVSLEAVLIVWDKVASLAYFFHESSIKPAFNSSLKDAFAREK